MELKYTDSDVDKIIGKKFAKWEEKQQKREQSICADLENRLSEYKKQIEFEGIKSAARKMLNEEEIFVTDDLLAIIVCEEIEKTKETVIAFVELFKAAVQKEAQRNFLRYAFESNRVTGDKEERC